MAIKRRPLTPEQEIARRSRRSFMVLGAGAVAAVAGWEWLKPDLDDDDIKAPLRSVLNLNEKVVRSAIYSNNHLAPTFPVSAIGNLKVNGDVGLDETDPNFDHIDVTPLGGSAKPVALADIRTLPRIEEVIEFKCVEGWSTVTQFAGARFADFTARFAPDSTRSGHVAMKTPDGEYYVGIDMPSAMHPQTLLAWEMNRQPLSPDHGAPLRLVIPVKYGLKNIKRIASVEYTNTRPADYWVERGYDYYVGL